MILKRGDKIHLAIPALGNVSPDAARRAAEADMVGLRAMYAAEGVEIVIWSANSTLAGPTVVAIFRNEEKP